MAESVDQGEAAERGRRRWLANLGVLSITLLVLLAVVEVGLRLTDYSFRLYPETIEFGAPDPVMLETGFIEDPEVFWVTPDYAEKLDAYRRSKPRLIFLGDSVTDLGHYDQALEARLRTRTGRSLSYGNLGTAGWSSYQGRAQMMRDVVPLAPAAVTLYFGWNDHWIGFGVEDEQVAAIKRGATGGALQALRLVQLVTQARLALAGREAAYPNRVPLADFRSNLESMVGAAREAGIVPFLITAASNHQVGQEPAYLEARWLRDLADLVPMHNAYVEAVREVASKTGAPLCDAAAAFEALEKGEGDPLMMADGIHLTEAGDQWLAGLLEACLEDHDLLEQVLD